MLITAALGSFTSYSPGINTIDVVPNIRIWLPLGIQIACNVYVPAYTKWHTIPTHNELVMKADRKLKANISLIYKFDPNDFKEK